MGCMTLRAPDKAAGARELIEGGFFVTLHSPLVRQGVTTEGWLWLAQARNI